MCVNGVNNFSVHNIGAMQRQTSPVAQKSATQNNNKSVAFCGTNDKSAVTFRTKLSTQEEKEAFNTVSSQLAPEDKKLLNGLLKSGILLKNNSDDKSTVLENLHKIATTQRAEGLENKVILKNVIQTLAFPYNINQKLGDIPTDYKARVLQSLLENKELNLKTLQAADEKFDDLRSSTCPTACVEFNLANKHQAEFARFANELTSPKMAVDKIVDMKNLSKNTVEAVYLLNAFKTPYEVINQDQVKVTLKPDKDALIRAQIQNSHQDGMERNATDVLIQSTFMNVGSQQGYNSLIDEREKGEFAISNTGLIEFEKTYLESIVENKSTTSMLYQQVNEDNVVTGYEADFKTMKKQILDTLKRDKNVIIGITFFEQDKDKPDKTRPENSIAGGHEITIVGARKDKNGETIFICQDSDDEVNMPIECPESWLLPRLHHAGLPDDIADRTIKDKRETWEISLENYKNSKSA